MQPGPLGSSGRPVMVALARWRVQFIGIGLLLAMTVAVILHSGDALKYQDERDYDQLARAMLHNQTFAFPGGTPTAYRPPGYPAYVAAAYLVDEHPICAKLENALTLVLAASALGLVARRMHPRGALLTPFLLACYPLIIYAASVVYPQIMGCLLLTVIILVVSGERLTLSGAAVAGFVYGMLILAIPYFILLLPAFAAYITFRDRGKIWSNTRPAFVMIGVAACVVIPWTVRNYVEYHELIPVSTNSGANLFLGNSPVTRADSGVTINVAPLCNRLQPGMGDYEVDSALGKCAFDWIGQNPTTALALYLEKVVNYFAFRNDIATENAGDRWQFWLVFATYYPLLVLVVARLAYFRRYPLGRTEALIYLLYFGNAFISSIYFNRLRFRIPFDFLLIAVAAAALCRYWDERRSPVRGAPGTSLPA